MRVLVVAALLLLPTAQALLTDPAGDVRLQGHPVPAGGEAVDLLALDIEETVEDLILTLAVDGLGLHDPPMQWLIPLRLGIDLFEIDIRKSSMDGADRRYEATLRRVDSAGIAEWQRSLDPPQVDEEQGQIVLALPRAYLATTSGNPAVAGDVILFGNVVAQPLYTGNPRDMMPDDQAESPFALRLGGVHVAGVDVAAHPLGWFSNGQAAIHGYELRFTSNQSRTIDLEAEDPPIGQTVLGRHRLHLEPGKAADLRAWLVVPFGHAHGTDREAVARVQAGGENVELPLRIRYPEVPQPTGHHDTVWIHQLPRSDPLPMPGAQIAFWSTLPDDPRSTKEAVPPNRAGGYLVDSNGLPTSIMEWEYRFSPDLLLDLDPRRDRPGLADLRFASSSVFPNPSVEVRVLFRDEAAAINQATETRIVAAGGPVHLGDLGPGDVVATTLPLVMPEPRGIIGAGPGFTLWGEVRLFSNPDPRGLFFGRPDITLESGSHLELPLREVEHAVATTPHGPLKGESPRHLGNGTLQVEFHGVRGQTYHVEVLGPAAEWLVGVPTRLQGPALLEIEVRVPPGTDPEARAIAAIVATPDDPSLAVGFWPLAAYVGDAQQAEEGLGDGGADADAPARQSPAAFVLAALLFALWRRR